MEIVPLREEHLTQLKSTLATGNFAGVTPEDKYDMVRHATMFLSKDPNVVYFVAVEKNIVRGLSYGTIEKNGNASTHWTVSFKKPEPGKLGAGVGFRLFEAKVKEFLNRGVHRVSGDALSLGGAHVVEKTAGSLGLDLKWADPKLKYMFTLSVKEK